MLENQIYIIWGQKSTKKCIFELVLDICEIREKWSLEKVLLRPKWLAQVNYFWMYGWETKFFNESSYRKIAFMLSFPINRLFLISQTIRGIIYWHFCPKAANGKNFILTKCLIILPFLMVGENP